MFQHIPLMITILRAVKIIKVKVSRIGRGHPRSGNDPEGAVRRDGGNSWKT